MPKSGLEQCARD